jgi:hypothetical protein
MKWYWISLSIIGFVYFIYMMSLINILPITQISGAAVWQAFVYLPLWINIIGIICLIILGTVIGEEMYTTIVGVN